MHFLNRIFPHNFEALAIEPSIGLDLAGMSGIGPTAKSLSLCRIRLETGVASAQVPSVLVHRRSLSSVALAFVGPKVPA